MTRVPALRNWLTSHRLLLDLAVAVAVLVASLPPLVNAHSCGCRPAPAWGFVLVALQSVLLLGRRQRPFTVSLAVGIATAVYGVSTLPDPALPFAGLVAVYSAASYASRKLALLSGACAMIGIAVSLSLDRADATAQDWSINYLVFATAWLLGWAARNSREVAAALEQRAEQLERTRESEAQRAVVEERNRIAREMHDLVAHALSLMVVQAEAGPVVLPHDPDRATAAFDAISDTGKSALTEMRRLLGVLRDDTGDSDTDTTGARSPQPGLDEIDDLVHAVRGVDLDVSVRRTGEPRPVSAAVDLTAYRIVQEALTNVLKHAGPARVAIVLDQRANAVTVEVTDDGLGSLGHPAGSAGRGLLGMRERVSLVGGDLKAGPGANGGWTVRACLPLDEARSR